MDAGSISGPQNWLCNRGDLGVKNGAGEFTMKDESADQPRYQRVILKLSGESFARSGERGISMEEVTQISKEIDQGLSLGCQISPHIQS